MSNVSAVVLTLDESHTERALASLAGQTLPPAETILVRGVTPFYRALNHGARQVQAELFIQVDADMVLDPDCIERLHACTTADTAVAVGRLRDSLEGPITGIKLWRTRCFLKAGMRNTISPDTELVSELKNAGWKRQNVPGFERGQAQHAVLGRHEPDYTPLYAYSRFRLLAARYRWRRTLPALRRRFAKLQRSPHAAAGFAQFGVAEGVFWDEHQDRLEPYGAKAGDERLLALSLAASDSTRPPIPLVALRETGMGAFDRLYALGRELAAHDAGPALRAQLDTLADRAEPDAPSSWAGALGLCRGALDELRGRADCKRERAELAQLFAEGEGGTAEPSRWRA